MSELRHDALTGQDVIVAAGRAARPATFAAPEGGAETAPDSTGECAFCPGSEAMTPPEVARDGAGAPDLPGWDVRVFPNLYPILGGTDAGPGTTGRHEVVVLSPDHRSLGQLDDREAEQVVTMWRDRVRAHLASGHAYAFAIVNHLPGAGASIVHPHAQVFALDVVPPAVDAALARVQAARRDLVVDDYEAAPSQIAREPVWVWCPHASVSPYFVRIAHPRAGARFDEAGDDTVAEVARAIRDTLARLMTVLGDAPYNLIVRTAPPERAPFHWYVDVIPRVSVVAGFEQATGILVNTVPPELAACALRDARP
jgi:UDPglucose--hexose-1-phosphate uridylyltransferase